MKTILIWDSCGENPLQYYVVPADVSYLRGTYIGLSGNDEDKEADLMALTEEYEPMDDFPVDVVQAGGAVKVIEVGFMP